ncbi:MAG TPA: NAD-dependent epimerase/dehydratase family protein [Roseiflexaceae bacterium]|nr:NAD-dependent epimerase/dehydratase family protein [Roseiflexaceae bacterium]HMP41321.1 NAD-dependent epimerase/dehydratase family protein [Roseiflexaceae bacterium]
MRAFVTGGTGLLGSNLVRQLLQEGHAVTVLARSQQKAAQVFAGLDVAIVTGDLADIAAFAPHLAGHDTVFHTAAYFREYYQPGDHWPTLKAFNIDATMALLRAAEAYGVRRVVHTSSSGTLGKANPATEATPPDELVFSNLYFRSKLEADQAIDAFLAHGTPLEVVRVLPGWMFGPGDSAPTSAGQIILSLLNRELPVIMPGYGNVTDARDVADGMIRAALHAPNGARYLLANPQLFSFAEIFREVEALSGVATPRIQAPRWFAYAYGWVSETYGRLTGRPVLATLAGVETLIDPHPLSSALAVAELGVSFRPLRDTLHDTIAWFRATRPDLLRTPDRAAA